jgi:hypothetical protein
MTEIVNYEPSPSTRVEVTVTTTKPGSALWADAGRFATCETGPALWADARRLATCERWARILALTPLFLRALVARSVGVEHTPKLMLSVATPLWTMRNILGCAMLIPLLLQFKRREAVNTKKKVESAINVAGLVCLASGTIALAAILSSRQLGGALPDLLVVNLAARGVGTSLSLLDEGYQRPRSREALLAALDSAFFVGDFLEACPYLLPSSIESFARSKGLIDSGFGLLVTGFGAASAIAALSLPPIKRDNAIRELLQELYRDEERLNQYSKAPFSTITLG